MEKFIEKQKIYHNIALEELKNGEKRTHWMWFIFPQVDGLGSSSYSQYYSIKGMAEAKKYWENSYLRNNYLDLLKVLLTLKENDAEKIFGRIDSSKLKSSLTLFYLVSKDKTIYKVLGKFFHHKLDDKTKNYLS